MSAIEEQPELAASQTEASADGQDPGGEHQLHGRGDDGHAAVQRQRLERLRFHDTAEELPGALMPDRVDVHAQRAGQQAPLQQATQIEREGRVEPARERPPLGPRGG